MDETRRCDLCRPRLILCVCGYEERGKRRLKPRLPDEALSPRGRRFRWLRGLVEGLTSSSRRRVYELVRLATALEHGPRREHEVVAEALWRAIASRDDGREGASVVRRAEHLMHSYFADLARFLTPPPPPEGQQPDPRPGHYYVSAVDADRFWLVSGPYARHADALDAVSEVRARAEKRDSRAYFFAWGTCRTEEPQEAIWAPSSPPAPSRRGWRIEVS